MPRKTKKKQEMPRNKQQKTRKKQEKQRTTQKTKEKSIRWLWSVAMACGHGYGLGHQHVVLSHRPRITVPKSFSQSAKEHFGKIGKNNLSDCWSFVGSFLREICLNNICKSSKELC